MASQFMERRFLCLALTQIGYKKYEKRESMNHVFLSGIVEKAPMMVSKESEITHVTLELTVTHLNASGKEKREKYPLSAWRGIAQRVYELVKSGDRISIEGYLCQKQTSEGVFLEITIREFQASSFRSVNQTSRLTSPIYNSENTSESKHGDNKAVILAE